MDAAVATLFTCLYNTSCDLAPLDSCRRQIDEVEAIDATGACALPAASPGGADAGSGDDT